MPAISLHKFFLTIGLLLAFSTLILIIELIFIKFNGTSVPVPDIPRQAETYGTGREITYVVMGDSTTVSQGGDYDKGIARATARHLAKQGEVTLHNLGVSGARAADVRKNQLPKALELNPDVVLIAATANDVTHLTPIKAIKEDLETIIRQIKENNPEAVIILTGSAQMGSVPRFPEPIKSFARYRTAQINDMVSRLSQKEQVIFAPIAEQTGPIFNDNPSLFAKDKFHPNTQGYQLWIDVINNALPDNLPL